MEAVLLKLVKLGYVKKNRHVFYDRFGNKDDYNVNTSKIHATSFI